MAKVTSAAALLKRVKPILAISLVMLLPLVLAACPTHTHIHG
jgi:hypothetical protein